MKKSLLIFVGGILSVVVCGCSSFSTLFGDTHEFKYEAVRWNADTIECRLYFGILSGFMPKNDGTSEINADKFECKSSDVGCKIIFTGLNSKEPKLISESEASVIIFNRSENSQTILLGETTATGTLNLYRIETATGLILDTKNTTGFIEGSNYGAIYLGQCKEKS